MELWIVFCLMTALAALFVVVPVLRARRTSTIEANPDIVVYADQLDELARDHDRGLIGEPEQAAARAEIGRRILKADQGARPIASSGTEGMRIAAAIIVGLIIPAVGIGLYAPLGNPSLPDAPLAVRQATPVEKLSAEDLIARLDQRLQANPNDVKGWDVAGPIYLRVGRFADAVNAFQNAIRTGGPTANRFAGLGEALTAVGQGVVTPEARTAFEAAVKLDAKFPLPQMYLALALSQDGKYRESADAWKRVIALGRGYEPWVASARKELAGVEAKIAEDEGKALVPTTPADPAMPGQVSGSGNPPPVAPPEAAQPMIEAMVARLSQRLDSQGGSADDWGKLMRSYLVLGRTDDAIATYAKAKSALSSNPAATSQLSSIAVDLGLPQ